MSEDKKAFTVSDRRHFTPEGEARAGVDAPETEPARPSEPMTAAAAPTPTPASAGASAPSTSPPEEEELPTDLVGLFISLAAQASFLLAGGPGGEGEDRPPDLGAARGLIALLELMKAKTEGNRSADEDKVLDEVLYQLRMAYLARSKASGA